MRRGSENHVAGVISLVGGSGGAGDRRFAKTAVWDLQTNIATGINPDTCYLFLPNQEAEAVDDEELVYPCSAESAPGHLTRLKRRGVHVKAGYNLADVMACWPRLVSQGRGLVKVDFYDHGAWGSDFGYYLLLGYQLLKRKRVEVRLSPSDLAACLNAMYCGGREETGKSILTLHACETKSFREELRSLLSQFVSEHLVIGVSGNAEDLQLSGFICPHPSLTFDHDGQAEAEPTIYVMPLERAFRVGVISVSEATALPVFADALGVGAGKLLDRGAESADPGTVALSYEGGGVESLTVGDLFGPTLRNVEALLERPSLTYGDLPTMSNKWAPGGWLPGYEPSVAQQKRARELFSTSSEKGVEVKASGGRREFVTAEDAVCHVVKTYVDLEIDPFELYERESAVTCPLSAETREFVEALSSSFSISGRIFWQLGYAAEAVKSYDVSLLFLTRSLKEEFGLEPAQGSES